ncbi:hypothetical protein [Peribacillus frigoritolerans]|uniref:hypothetical protein n=1 Tax=Peribacillus frigoritolerans TaxID=450367 RepID=UPI000FD7DE50|nr:hypothetical protein [Peribacillus frigoritolerans]AZV62621.1 hypothetical protein DOZ91_20190 [Peribacillus frigoritolerans]
MFDFDKTREKIKALDETDAKNIVMLTMANLEMAKDGKGDFTSDRCVDALIKLLNSIPEPNVLKEMYKNRKNDD